MIYGVDSENGYRPYPIPPRDATSFGEAPKQIRHGDYLEPASDHDSFVMIDIAESCPGPLNYSISHHHEAQPIEQGIDGMRTLFGDMRQIARQGSWYHRSREEVFYRQAKLMEHFIDDYHAEVEFSRYFPSYSKMDSAQLRTYFTWRTKVREGRVTETSVSYAFLYIYELLHNIGVKDPQEGLDRFVGFWSEFRIFDPLIDKYVLPWFKDYYVFYPLAGSFKDFAADNLLQEHYPAVFCYGSGKADSFGLFSQVSSYDIRKSIFYTEETEQMIAECFFSVLTKFRQVFAKKRKRFEDEVFFVMHRKSKWVPFKKALFYPYYQQDDRVVAISEREVYEYKDRAWAGKTVLASDHGSQLVGYTMKEIEAFLRTAMGFKYKLAADLRSFKAVDLTGYTQLGISLPDIIKEACAEFLKLHTHRKVSIDLDNLMRIRLDAFETQGKLLVPENNDPAIDPALPALSKHDAEASRKDPTTPLERSGCTKSSDCTGTGHSDKENVRDTEPTDRVHAGQSSSPQESTDVWAAFASSLTRDEAKALSLVLEGGDIRAFAQQHAVMLEVLVDGINQNAMDVIGDAVIEIGDTVFAYEEYEDDLMEAVIG